MPSTRLDDVRRQLADAVEQAGDLDPGDVLRIALWRVDGGDRSRPDQLRAAARHAWTLFASEVAERLARAALESGPELEAGFLLGAALSDQGRPEEALAAWAAVGDLPGSDRVRASLASDMAGVLAYYLDRPAEAGLVLRRAADRIRDASARRLVEGVLASLGATNPSVASVDAEVLAPQGQPGTDPPAPNAALAAAVEWANAGRLELAVETTDRALATAAEWTDEFPTIAVLLQMTRVWALALAGHLHEAQAEAQDQYAYAARARSDGLRADWCVLRGMVALLRGSPRAARGPLREAAALLTTSDHGFLRPARAYLAMVHALVGEFDAAEQDARAASHAIRSVDRVFGVDVARAGAWVYAARGELTAPACAGPVKVPVPPC